MQLVELRLKRILVDFEEIAAHNLLPVLGNVKRLVGTGLSGRGVYQHLVKTRQRRRLGVAQRDLDLRPPDKQVAYVSLERGLIKGGFSDRSLFRGPQRRSYQNGESESSEHESFYCTDCVSLVGRTPWSASPVGLKNPHNAGLGDEPNCERSHTYPNKGEYPDSLRSDLILAGDIRCSGWWIHVFLRTYSLRSSFLVLLRRLPLRNRGRTFSKLPATGSARRSVGTPPTTPAQSATAQI